MFVSDCGGEGLGGLPRGRDVTQGCIKAALEACQNCRAARGGFHVSRAFDRDAQDVGQELREPIVVGHAAVDPQHGGRLGPRRQQVLGLIGRRLERSAGEMGRAGVAGKARENAAGLGFPVGRTKAGKGRHKIDAAVVVEGARQGAGFGAGLHDIQCVAQPFDGGARVKRAALRGVDRASVYPVGEGGEQGGGRRRGRGAVVGQDETAGAVGCLGHPGLGATLADEGRVLIAGDAADRQRDPEDRSVHGAEVRRAIAHRRQNRGRHVEYRAEVIAPGLGVNVEQHRAGRIGRIGAVVLARGEPPQEKRIDGAEGEVAGVRAGTGTRHMVEQPRQLGGREVRVEAQPGGGANDISFAGRL